MKYRTLGTTDLRVSEIAVGCSGFWGNKRFPEQDAEKIVFEAFDLGVNLFDTGHNYCNYQAEPRLGRSLKKLIAGQGRDKLVISTKAGTVVPSAPLIPSSKPLTKNFSANYIEDTILKSIKNLNCEYLDIFQLHGISSEELSPELSDRLHALKQKGLFRYLGVNTHSRSDMFNFSKRADLIDMALIDYNVIQLDREPAIDAMSKAGMGVVAGTVLAQAHLVKGKLGRIKSLGDVWYLARALLKPTSRKLAKPARKMREVMSRSDLSPVQIAFAFVLGNQQIASCVFGTTNLNNLKEVCDSSHLIIPDELQREIRAVFDELTTDHSG